eukprot:TRINITY_DN5315_c0_g1_i5.p1 TRINITY_DN5315_c0_g1~~TRINITY_DN5315_c0_g1_i5.p1  ORF type:complete len:287 (-),score=46.61 TRINITY_DN5315_c0_g1_i5:33-833(-)
MCIRDSSNTVYQSTKRNLDHMDFYNNYQNLESTYKTHYIDSIEPNLYSKAEYRTNTSWRKDLAKKQEKEKNDIDYLKSLATSTSPADKSKYEQFQRESNFKEKEMLQTGVEHWNSVYKSDMNQGKEFSKVSRPDWTKHKPAYYSESKITNSEYRTKFGKMGSKPFDIMDQTSNKLARIEDDLKMGTTQCCQHIPGYTGYVPAVKTATLAYEHGKGENPRQTFIKQNILENYSLRIPNYAGYVPTNSCNLKGNLRQHCFSTQGEFYN